MPFGWSVDHCCSALPCLLALCWLGPEGVQLGPSSGLSGGQVAMVKHILQKSSMVLEGEGDALNVEQEEKALVTESLGQGAEHLIWEQVLPAWPTKESAFAVDDRELLAGKLLENIEKSRSGQKAFHLELFTQTLTNGIAQYKVTLNSVSSRLSRKICCCGVGLALFCGK